MDPRESKKGSSPPKELLPVFIRGEPFLPRRTPFWLGLLAIIAAGALAWVFLAAFARGAQVQLQWRANPEPDLAGYWLCWGPSSFNYTNSVRLGRGATNFSMQVSGRQYFALSAFTSNGVDSFRTAELVYNPPPPGPRVPVGFDGVALWLVTEQSCDTVFWEAAITNEVPVVWPLELFRLRTERAKLK